jgi:pyruvate,water dikinase
MKNQNIIPFEQLNMSHLQLVGGKNASLGEMIQNLTQKGISVPSGFAVTVQAYELFINYNHLSDKILKLIKGADLYNITSLRKVGFQIRQLIINGQFPNELKKDIDDAYQLLSENYNLSNIDVAVRSSATAEDLPDASFAGQQDTYLNIRGSESLLHAVKNCFASLFTDRAISYREMRGFGHFEIGLSVGVQKMVRSDLGASGVAFSLDTESGFKDVVLINGSYGLGEMIVQGSISPDEFIVFKPTLKKGFNAILEKKLGKKMHKMIYGTGGMEKTKIVAVPSIQQSSFCISDDVALQLTSWVIQIEEYYSELKGGWCPMDVEWAFDGLSNELYIVQARPETIHSQKDHSKIIEYKINNTQDKKVITTGIAVGDGIGSGNVKILYNLDKRDGGIDPAEFQEGDVLVTDMTDPDWEPIMKKASAIITNKGGRTCHAAIVAREMGIPAIVGTSDCTEKLKSGDLITASCAEGEIGYIYEGTVAFEKIEIDLNTISKSETPVMLNVASPDLAFKFSHLPNAGVGLAREEFIINNYIQAHPLALLKHKTLGDENLSKKIEKLIEGFSDERDFFVKKLSYGIAKIAAAFYPNNVIVRFSDFKSNEYENLLGGSYFEPHEENPMIGWRGASRYYSEKYKEAFGMECEAIKKVREEYGLDNVIVMIPFCRTVKECEKVIEVMKEFGLKRGENSLQIYLMAEVPSNIILAEEFAKHIDGFSIGSNDLTQLTLGLDRDSDLVANLYDERDEAVKYMIKKLIKTAKETNTKVGICGQGPSDFPEFAQFLVQEGIDSISVTPDAIIKTLINLKKTEGKFKIAA